MFLFKQLQLPDPREIFEKIKASLPPQTRLLLQPQLPMLAAGDDRDLSYAAHFTEPVGQNQSAPYADARYAIPEVEPDEAAPAHMSAGIAEPTVKVDFKPNGGPGDDDGTQVTSSSSSETGVINTKKKYGPGDGAVYGAQKTETTVVKDGENENTHQKTLKGTYDKENGVTLARTVSDESAAGEGPDAVSGKTSHTVGGDIGADHVHLKVGNEAEAKAGQNGKGSGNETSVGYGKDGLELERTNVTKTETAAGKNEHETSFGLKGDKIALGSKDSAESKAAGERTSKSEVAVGLDGVEASKQWSQTNEQGTTRSAKVGGEIGDGKVEVNAGYSMTNKNGSGFSVSAKAGTEVEAGEPVKVGDRYVVHYKKTTTVGGGAGGTAKAVSVHAEASHGTFDEGSRSFESEKEALEFKEHAAELIHDSPDPRTIAGALDLQIGESRGHGSEDAEGAGASASYSGITAGADVHRNAQEQIEVKRLSANIFEVTASDDTSTGHDVHGDVLKVGSATHDNTTTKSHAVSVQFDLATAEGKSAFEEYCKTKKVPKAGAHVSTEDDLDHTVTDSLNIKGFGTLTEKHDTTETTIVDEKGKHEIYRGDDSIDVKTGWVGRQLGDKDVSLQTEILARQENDKDAGYVIENHIGGNSGAWNRGKMQHIAYGGKETDAYSQGDTWDESKVEPSGDWTMSVEVSNQAMDNLVAEEDRFKGLETNDDKMRAVTDYVANGGIDAVNDISRHGEQTGKPIEWDLELKGNPSFPGRQGREQIEAKIEKYSALMSAGAGSSAPLVAPLQGEITALEARLADVSDPAKYTDLPKILREQEEQKIRTAVAQFEGMRHQAAMEAMKSDSGESPEAVSKRTSDPHAYDKLNPQQRQLAELRDQISVLDRDIIYAEHENAEARSALAQFKGDDIELAKYKTALSHQQVVGQTGGNATEALHEKMFVELDGMRIAFIKSMADPVAAAAIGQSLLNLLQAQYSMAISAGEQLTSAAKADLQMSKAGARLQGGDMAKHGEYWQDIELQIEADEVAKQTAGAG